MKTSTPVDRYHGFGDERWHELDDLPDEEWRTVVYRQKIWEHYQVSNWGRVKSLSRVATRSNGRPHTTREKIRRTPDNGRGYTSVMLCDDGYETVAKTHVLVAEAFFGERPDNLVIRHLNDVKHDNRVVNIAYGTQAENVSDSIRNGVHSNTRKTHCHKGHPLSGDNLKVTTVGHRRCRTCSREWMRSKRSRARFEVSPQSPYPRGD